MANVIINDLAVSKALDNTEMADIHGGSYQPMPKQSTPLDSTNEPLSQGTQGIVIIGEEKYGGWGGEW